ncbi:MAG: ion channel [Bacteroidota bacterium]|nr:ion channel [Bacteroidota bacterium]
MFREKLSKYILYILLLLYLVLIHFLVKLEADCPGANIENYWDGLWYAVITLTTVGYGDYYPVSTEGKILGLIIVLSSLGLLGYLIGNVTNNISKYMENKKSGYYGTNFSGHFVVFGWDKFGQQVIDQIVKANRQVAIITDSKIDIDLIQDLYPSQKVFTFFSDFNNFEAFTKVNIDNSATVFINFPDDTETLVYVLNLKKHYNNLNFVVSLDKPDLKETYQAIGVTYAISKNEIASKLVASYIFEPDVAHITEDLMATTIDENDYDILEYIVLETNPYCNKNYIDAFIDIKTTHDCVLIGMSKKDGDKYKLLKNPGKDVNINPGDYLILMANGRTKQTIEKTFGVKEGR